MQILFSDLGQMFIDSRSGSWETTAPVFERIRQKRIPWVLVTNKTRAEIELWSEETGIRYPFIVEDGAAIFFPKGQMSLPFRAKVKSGYQVLEFGNSHDELITDLERACEMSGCLVRTFHEMELGELSQDAGFSPFHALLAKQREYSEAFRILHGDPERLTSAIQQIGRRIVWRDRFFHITGNNHVAGAVRIVAQAFALSYGNITKIGIGTGPYDTPFLKLMDRVVLAGPDTWNEATLTILQD
jgi:mannosyl-3-phosphoglycerate phosphatase family protein